MKLDHPPGGRSDWLDLAGMAVLSGIIFTHVAGLTAEVEETTYIGAGFILIGMAALVAVVLIGQRDMRGWILCGLTGLANGVGFVLSRTVGLPNHRDEIGNWAETMGQWSLCFNIAAVLLAIWAIARHSSAFTSKAHQ